MIESESSNLGSLSKYSKDERKVTPRELIESARELIDSAGMFTCTFENARSPRGTETAYVVFEGDLRLAAIRFAKEAANGNVPILRCEGKFDLG